MKSLTALLSPLLLLFFAATLHAQPASDTLPPVQNVRLLPPPPPPPPPPPVDSVYKVVEHMPRFPGCEDRGTEQEKKACAQEKLMAFIYGHLQYPAEAREQCIEGIVVVSFIVRPDGTVSDATIVRDIGGGCGEEAVRLVNLMNEKRIRWTPQRSRSRPVSVMFNLPVKFVLD